MPNNINQILDLFIKLGIVIGIVFSIYFYCKIGTLNSKIERENNKFEEESKKLRGQGRGIQEDIINRQIDELRKNKDDTIAPIERERQRLLSKIPFLK